MDKKQLKQYLLTWLNSVGRDGTLSLTYYTKGKNNNWYCDIYFYDYTTHYRGETKACGYGYDKQSTSVSNALNIFKTIFKRYKSGKHKTSYGLYDDNSISYGIGISAVISCIKCFKNVKIKSIYNGINENNITLTIKRK